MRRFKGDQMPRRDAFGKAVPEQIHNFGMQDPKIVCGPVVRVDEIPGQREVEAVQQPETQQQAMQPVDVVRALHMVAAQSGLNFQQPKF